MRRVRLVRLFPVTVDDLWSLSNPYNILGEGEIHRIIYGAYYVPFLKPFSNFDLFFHFPISYYF
jgi:hypothetical protein